MRRSRWWGHRTGYGVFVLGTGMGMITNLVTGDPERWPGALQPIATYSPAIGAGLLAAVGAKATWDVWRNGVARPQWTGSEPYPGLTAYTEERAGVFFGRRREVEELVDRVRHARAAAGRFVPVIGPSGSGKSSLVQAGLLPALRPGREFEVLPPFSPGASAVGELAGVLGVDLAAAAGLALEAARQGHPAPPLPGVLAALSTLRAGARGVLLIVDQLEEAVTQCVEEDRHGLLALIEAMLEQEPRLRVVATVRSDTIGAFQHGPGRDLFHDPLMVNVLGAREIRQVVTEPARLTATTFDDGLVDEIVRDAGGGDALPLLSYLLSDLYRHAAGDRRITWREYQNGGGVSGAITRQAQAAVRELGPDALGRCLDTLLLFVTLGPGGATRQPVRRSGLDESRLRVVRTFVDARLLVSDRDTFDIAHEALLRQWQPLAEHIVLHEESLRRLTELAPMARAWRRSGRQADYLITGARLADALTWARDGRALDPDVREFLDESQRNETGEMDRRADRAAREALAALQREPEFATALALAAYTELAPTPLAAYALEAALADGLLRVIRHPKGVASVSYGAGLLATACEDGIVRLWSDTGPALRELSGHEDGAGCVAVGADGRVATAAGDGTVRVWEDDATLHADRFLSPIRLAYTPDGRLLIGAGDGVIRMWDADLHVVATLADGAKDGPLYSLATDAAGRIVAGFGSGTVLRWDELGRPAQRLTGHPGAVFAVALRPDGRVAVGGRGARIIFWDETEVSSTVIRDTYAPLGALAYDSTGRLAAGFDDGVVRVWEADGELCHVLTEHAEPISGVAFAADGRLAVGSRDRTVRVLDLGGRLVTTDTRRIGTELDFAPDGTLLIGDEAGAQPADPLDDISPRVRVYMAVRQLSSSAIAAGGAIGGTLVGGHNDGTVVVRTAAGAILTLRPSHAAAVVACAVAPDGRLATGSVDGEIRIWDAEGALLHTIAGRAGMVHALAFAPDGRLATACARALNIRPHGTEPATLVALATKHDREPLTPQQRRAAMLATAPDHGG
ncbi:AAA family ATPase [Actinoplanes solisilvae]|uniref:nSTAND1 domain-containing NTPase n=1 Tax=Actinoplanes solisilvae TaxID=2486853 RepID=UPI000FD81BE0|nr:AAA family ATPase [Actinoplanes solisilvae]